MKDDVCTVHMIPWFRFQGIRNGGERNRQDQGRLCCVPRLSVGLVKQLAKALNGKVQFRMAA